MSLYDGLGLSFVDIKSCGSWFFFFFFFRMQRNSVPTIHCVVELHWLRVDV
jgi:hypothetical protein